MPADPRKLSRILRVRTLQLGLVRAEEARANDRVASETALRDRISLLADAIAPMPAAPIDALGFAAAAHYRERLHASAQAASDRVATASRSLVNAQAQTREARRDQSAVEKLLARADHVAALKAIRALEDLPAARSGKRHDPC